MPHTGNTLAGPDVLELDRTEATSHRLDLSEVSFSRNAQMTIREAVAHIASSVRLPPETLSMKLDQKLYWLEPSGVLVIAIEVPEIDADMFVEIPPGHWWINEDCGLC